MVRPSSLLWPPTDQKIRPADIYKASELIKNGADINFSIKICQICAERMDIYYTDISGFTPLIAAAHGGDTTLVNLLLNAGANVNQQDDAGANALYWATSSGQYDTSVDLIRRGADIKTAYDSAVNRHDPDSQVWLKSLLDGGHLPRP
jgi:ankyrin repeat protein